MDDKLFEKTRVLEANVIRNIVSLKISQNLFDDLSQDEALTTTAQQAEMRVKRHIPTGVLARAFHYTTAIDYPFHTEPYLATRYGDGSFPVWYGSLEENTALMETAYHMWQAESEVAGASSLQEPIVRERAVYQVTCRAILIDLTGQQKKHPPLVAQDYAFTQMIGKRIAMEGHPGLLAPSARAPSGTNAVIFNVQVLGNPRIIRYLVYCLNMRENVLIVKGANGRAIGSIDYTRAPPCLK